MSLLIVLLLLVLLLGFLSGVFLFLDRASLLSFGGVTLLGGEPLDGKLWLRLLTRVLTI